MQNDQQPKKKFKLAPLVASISLIFSVASIGLGVQTYLKQQQIDLQITKTIKDQSDKANAQINQIAKDQIQNIDSLAQKANSKIQELSTSKEEEIQNLNDQVLKSVKEGFEKIKEQNKNIKEELEKSYEEVITASEQFNETWQNNTRQLNLLIEQANNQTASFIDVYQSLDLSRLNLQLAEFTYLLNSAYEKIQFQNDIKQAELIIKYLKQKIEESIQKDNSNPLDLTKFKKAVENSIQQLSNGQEIKPVISAINQLIQQVQNLKSKSESSKEESLEENTQTNSKEFVSSIEFQNKSFKEISQEFFNWINSLVKISKSSKADAFILNEKEIFLLKQNIQAHLINLRYSIESDKETYLWQVQYIKELLDSYFPQNDQIKENIQILENFEIKKLNIDLGPVFEELKELQEDLSSQIKSSAVYDSSVPLEPLDNNSLIKDPKGNNLGIKTPIRILSPSQQEDSKDQEEVKEEFKQEILEEISKEPKVEYQNSIEENQENLIEQKIENQKEPEIKEESEIKENEAEKIEVEKEVQGQLIEEDKEKIDEENLEKTEEKTIEEKSKSSNDFDEKKQSDESQRDHVNKSLPNDQNLEKSQELDNRENKESEGEFIDSLINIFDSISGEEEEAK